MQAVESAAVLEFLKGVGDPYRGKFSTEASVVSGNSLGDACGTTAIKDHSSKEVVDGYIKRRAGVFEIKRALRS